MLDPFYEAIAWLVVHIHGGLEPVFGKNWSWALAIVFLTMAMRLLLFPLFVKQIKNQRAMTALQPKMKELQAKYKNDKERLNQEMMALWKEHGANPFAGCLPLILQIPVFIALFRVLNSIKPNSGLPAHVDCTHQINFPRCFNAHYGISQNDVAHFAIAKIFGVPISAAFSSSQQALAHVGGSTTSTKVLSAILIILMGASTFWTQRQLMARSTATGAATGQMAQQQKILLYVLPLTFAVFGYRFPLGVLLYWLTTNLWSMAQQHFVIARMDAAAAASAPGAGGTPLPSGPAPGAKPVRPAPKPESKPAPNPPAAPPTDAGPTTPAGPGAPDGAVAPKPEPRRRPTSRNRRKRGRR